MGYSASENWKIGLALLCVILWSIFAGYAVLIIIHQTPPLGATANDGTIPLVKGVANPDIKQNNIKDNICNSKWTTGTIRPPSNYTSVLKLKQMRDFGLTGTPADYEEDHLISLTDGGHPTDPNNLWPQKYPKAKDKDRYELIVHKQICSGELTLQQGQDRLRQWSKYFKPTLGGVEFLIDNDDENAQSSN